MAAGPTLQIVGAPPDKSRGMYVPSFTVSWQGGEPPFQLQKCAEMKNPISTSAWENVGNPTMTTSKVVPNDTPYPVTITAARFFRVESEVPLLDGTVDAQGVHLTWTAPDLE